MSDKSELTCGLSLFAVLFALLIYLLTQSGCAGAQADARLSTDFAKCDTEAKIIAKVGRTCSGIITELTSLMATDECKGFPWSTQPDGGITIGGHTYICHREVPLDR